MAEYDKNLAVAGTHTLETKGLRKRYGRRVVVKDVSLRVKSGEVVGLLGPNGAGKTTTFYMVVGLIVADGGSIYLDGKDITHLPIYRRAHMGLTYLPQEASVFRSLTVEDNIRAILELQKNEAGKPLSKTEINERLESLLDELSIQNIRTNVAMSLSGGERRRTEIARSLAASPKFILLDEPFAGVDPIAERNPKHHPDSEGTEHRCSDHGPQRPGDLQDLRPCLYHQRRQCARRRCSGRAEQQRDGPQDLSRRRVRLSHDREKAVTADSPGSGTCRTI